MEMTLHITMELETTLFLVYVKAAGDAGGTGAVTEGTQTTAVGVVAANTNDLVIAVNGVDVVFDTALTGDIAADLATVQASAGVANAVAAGAIVTAKEDINLLQV